MHRMPGQKDPSERLKTVKHVPYAFLKWLLWLKLLQLPEKHTFIETEATEFSTLKKEKKLP